ncbi:MAG: sulfatase [Candidatus Hydrogenedentes bacterium]|nr:sulfatase [Candidatus Hydrogenedentota bacterium]
MKNIVLLITDTFRYDNLGERARRVVRTPELDRFAATRATEIRGFAMGSFPTIPHRTDLATGRLGWPHYGWQPIDESSPNHLARMLGEAGYVTQLICDCPHLFPARFDRAFDAAFQHRGQEFDRPLLHLNDPIERVQPAKKTRSEPTFRGERLPNIHRWTNRYYRLESETFAMRTAATAQRWLEENYKVGPFFLWADFFDPHEPWDPPEYLVRRHDPDYDGPPMLHPNYGAASEYTPEELRNLWAHYAAESELVDRALGRVLQKMDDLQLWDDTIVVVLSDHGMSLGEHDRCGKSNLSKRDKRFWPAYPEISHSLFLIAGGEVPCGQSLDLIAQPMDIAPTLCELANVKVRPPVPFQGKSFAVAVIDGLSGHRDCAVTGEYYRSNRSTVPGRGTTPFLVTGKWGYAPVGANGKPELYALNKDPLAEENVAGKHPRMIEQMQRFFIEYLKEHEAPDCVITRWSQVASK